MPGPGDTEGGMAVPTFRSPEIAALVAVLQGVIALLALEIAAAGSGLPMHACQLITPKDVQSVLGSGYAPEEMLHNEIQSTCGYKQHGGNTIVLVSFSRTIYDSPQYLKMEQQGMKQSAAQVNVTQVTGLGEGAFYFVGTGQNGPVFQLHFGKGTLHVILDVETNQKPNVDAALKLARIAYPRIP